MKSGCKAEADTAANCRAPRELIAVFRILAWRMFCMTMINRSQPHAKTGSRNNRRRNEAPRSSSSRQGSDHLPCRNRIELSGQDRAIGWLSRACQRPAAGQHRHVARLTRLTDTKLGATISAELIGKVHRTLTIKKTAYAAGPITELKCARYRPANPDVHRHLSG